MHRAFRKALNDATGVSEFVIVVNLDIRGFSAFSKTCESPDTAMFIKRVYMKFLDDYFADLASFFKPTGDGLLLTIPYNEENLQEIAQKTVSLCFDCLSDFGSFCVNDPMVPFEVPTKLGIGIARGTACRLVSKGKTLDYAGRVLNLASRLMDFARPTGLVLDGAFDMNLLDDEQIESLEGDSNVYIRGIAEKEPIEIFYTKDLTQIPSHCHQPIAKISWVTFKEEIKLREINEKGPRFRYYLENSPADPDDISVQIEFPAVRKERRIKDTVSLHDFSNFDFKFDADAPMIVMDYATLYKYLKTRSVKDNWDVTITIRYPGKG